MPPQPPSPEKKQKSSPDYSAWVRSLWEASDGLGGSKREDGTGLPPALYIVATPIGNLGDITLRALHTLAHVDLVLCEDTRVTGGLLHRYGIKKPLLSYHDHNAEERQLEILARLGRGEAVALVSDAGTPLISDPGYRLVQACRAQDIPVVAVPGASALLTALASAGLPTDRFLFVGFLPSKATARDKALQELMPLRATLVFYEAPSRLHGTLAAMEQILGAKRPVMVARELTKLYEDIRPAAAWQGQPDPKGELVILVGPPEEQAAEAADLDTLLREALRHQTLRDAAAAVAKATGMKKNVVYQRALALEAGYTDEPLKMGEQVKDFLPPPSELKGK